MNGKTTIYLYFKKNGYSNCILRLLILDKGDHTTIRKYLKTSSINSKLYKKQ